MGASCCRPATRLRSERTPSPTKCCRYVITDHTGKMQMPGPDGAMMDAPFVGMSVEGYDNVKKEFVSTAGAAGKKRRPAAVPGRHELMLS